MKDHWFMLFFITLEVLLAFIEVLFSRETRCVSKLFQPCEECKAEQSKPMASVLRSTLGHYLSNFGD